METILHLLDAIHHSKQRCILATIVHVEGTAYLKEGTLMVIKEDGTKKGMLSAGCLEEDVLLRAKDIFVSQQPQIVTYDLRDEDDYGWGLGAGCNGFLYILLEPVTDQLKQELANVRDCLQKGHRVLHRKEFSKDFTFIGYSFSYLDSEGPSNLGYSNPLPFVYRYIFEPAPRMIIFGAGEDAKPLVSLASDIGFRITLCDWRPHWCNKVTFPAATEIIIGTPDEIVNKIDVTEKDFMIVMSHSFRKDQEFIQGLVHKPIRYLGVMGRRERTNRLIHRECIPAYLSSPIGIPIGAKGPAEIAVSIMAEIIQELRREQKESKENEQT